MGACTGLFFSCGSHFVWSTPARQQIPASSLGGFYMNDGHPHQLAPLLHLLVMKGLHCCLQVALHGCHAPQDLSAAAAGMG